MFIFIDDKIPRNYSFRKELKSLSISSAKKNNLETEEIAIILLDVDRMKSSGKLSDREILTSTIQNVVKK